MLSEIDLPQIEVLPQAELSERDAIEVNKYLSQCRGFHTQLHDQLSKDKELSSEQEQASRMLIQSAASMNVKEVAPTNFTRIPMQDVVELDIEVLKHLEQKNPELALEAKKKQISVLRGALGDFRLERAADARADARVDALAEIMKRAEDDCIKIAGTECLEPQSITPVIDLLKLACERLGERPETRPMKDAVELDREVLKHLEQNNPELALDAKKKQISVLRGALDGFRLERDSQTSAADARIDVPAEILKRAEDDHDKIIMWIEKRSEKPSIVPNKVLLSLADKQSVEDRFHAAKFRECAEFNKEHTMPMNARDKVPLWQQNKAKSALLLPFKYASAYECSSKLPNLSKQNHGLGFQVRISGVPLGFCKDYFNNLVNNIRDPKLPIGSLILSGCFLENTALQTVLEAVASGTSHCNCLLDLSDNLPDHSFTADPHLMIGLARRQRRIVRLSSICVPYAVQTYLSKVEDICAELRNRAMEEVALEESSRVWWSTFISTYPSHFQTSLVADFSTFQRYIEQKFDTPKKRLRMPQSQTPHMISFKLTSDVPYPEDVHHRKQIRKLILQELTTITGLPSEIFKRVVFKRGSLKIVLIIGAVHVAGFAGAVASAVVVAYVQRRRELARDLGPEFVLGRIDRSTIQEGPTETQDLLEHSDGKKRILFLDGGGIRGMITLHMLECLENELNRRIQLDFPNVQATLSDLFDLIVGTSTGGIIAHALRNGMTAAHIQSLYRELAQEVFGREPVSLWVADKNGWFAKVIRSTPLLGRIGVGGWLGLSRFLQGAWYDDEKLRSLLQQHLRVQSTRVYVTTLELGTQSRLLVGDGVQELDASEETLTSVPAVDALRMTSAAPGFFKPVRGNGLEFVDGGVFAMNPTQHFLDTLAFHAIANPQDEGQWNNPIVVSFGTGIFNEENAGRLYWTRFVSNVVQSITETERTHRTVALNCHRLGTCYHRLNVKFPPGVVIDIDTTDSGDLAKLQQPLDPEQLDHGTPCHTRSLPGQQDSLNIEGQRNFDFQAVIDDALGSGL